METNDNIKIELKKNLDKHSFSTAINIPIDSSVNVKSVLDIDAYLYDLHTECGGGKAVFTGKIGVKVLYIDTDNITNTISDSQSISESILDGAITSDSFIILNSCVTPSVLSTDGTLKIVCELNVSPMLFVNLALPNRSEKYEDMIVKKTEISAATIIGNINSSFNYSVNFETRDEVQKILCYNAYFVPEKVTPSNACAIVEGKIFAKFLFETADSDQTCIKEISDVFNVKTEIGLDACTSEMLLDLNFNIDSNNTQISTDKDEDNNIISITHTINVVGVMSSLITIQLDDDIYSVNNEIELTETTREYCKDITTAYSENSIYGEINIQDNDTAIDEIISVLNIQPEVTNFYAKNDTLFIEGVISSQVLYLDENKEYKSKTTQLPYSVDTKIKTDESDTRFVTPFISNCKAKAKRGTIIELDYTLDIACSMFIVDEKTMVDNISIGRPLDFSNYDYQIFIAKPGETRWDLCKRIKIEPERLNQCNKNLPEIMQGGEKVIIKR